MNDFIVSINGYASRQHESNWLGPIWIRRIRTGNLRSGLSVHNTEATNIRKISPYQQRAWEWWCPSCEETRYLKSGPATQTSTRIRVCLRCANIARAEALKIDSYPRFSEEGFSVPCTQCGAARIVHSGDAARSARLCGSCASTKRGGWKPAWTREVINKRRRTCAEKYGWDIREERPCAICGNMIARSPGQPKRLLCSPQCIYESIKRMGAKGRGSQKQRDSCSLARGGTAVWESRCVICSNLFFHRHSTGNKNRPVTCSKECIARLRSRYMLAYRARERAAKKGR